MILAFEARKFSDRMLLHDILVVTEDLSVYKPAIERKITDWKTVVPRILLLLSVQEHLKNYLL